MYFNSLTRTGPQGGVESLNDANDVFATTGMGITLLDISLWKGEKTMTTELTSRSQSAKHPAVLKLMGGAPFSQRMQQVYDNLARRAYELFESRGCQHGHDLEDWFRAECELLNPTPVEISDADDQVIVRAVVPGLSDKDIEVRVAPHRLIITGRREPIRDQEKRKTHSETSSYEVVRMLDLSQEIDPDEVTATVQNGTLEVLLPKAHPAKNNPVEVKAA